MYPSTSVDRRLARISDAMAFSSNAAPLDWSFPDVPEQAATVATVSPIPDYLKGIHEECLTAILAIEEHGAEMSPAAWQQVRNARSIRRLVQDILLCLMEAGDHSQEEPLAYFKNIRKWSREALSAHRAGEHTEVTRLAWSILARTRAVEQWHEDRNTVQTQLVALGAEEGSERSTQTAMTRSGMPPEPTEKTDEENTDGSASVGETEVDMEPEVARDQDAQAPPAAQDAYAPPVLQDAETPPVPQDAEAVAQDTQAPPVPIHEDNPRNQSPLHAAAKNGHVDLLKILLTNLTADGAALTSAIDARDFLNMSPLHEAVIYGNSEVVELLLNNGANVNAVDLFGQQPLHHAARHGLSNIVQLLLQRGADARARDAQNMTAREKAEEHKFSQVTELIDSFQEMP